METSSGLTRRRGGGRGAGDGSDGSRVTSPAPHNGSHNDNRVPETSYIGGENGHKIAFDPRDISESADKVKQPKLTLMEEVLLLGLKDKQVRCMMSSKFAGFPVINTREWNCVSLAHAYNYWC